MDPLQIIVLTVVVLFCSLIVGFGFAVSNREVGEIVKDISEASEDLQESMDDLQSKLNLMTKSQIEDYGRSLGVELDKRKTKVNMIKDLLKQKEK